MSAAAPPTTPEHLTLEWNADHLTERGYVSSHDVREALHRIGRDHGPALLAEVDFSALLDDDVLAWAVPQVWCMVEHPLAALDAETWRGLFERSGFTTDGAPAERPSEALVLYRGADHAHRLGWSWTDDLDLARWFAARPYHREPGQVWSTSAEPAHLLARISTVRVGEREWVLDPEGLTTIGPAGADR